MQTLQYRPSAPLSAYVDLLWYRCGREPQRKRQRALPTGNVDLTFNLHEDSIRVFTSAADTMGIALTGAVVHGPQSRYFVLDARRDVHVVGVHFRAAGAALLGWSPQALGMVMWRWKTCGVTLRAGCGRNCRKRRRRGRNSGSWRAS